MQRSTKKQLELYKLTLKKAKIADQYRGFIFVIQMN